MYERRRGNARALRVAPVVSGTASAILALPPRPSRAGSDPISKRGYHHGNLRQALVEAALDLMAEKGPTGFTMAEAAKRAEVSAAAPYRHFSGREDLIAEVATQGYQLLADVLDYAYNDGKPSPLAAFEAVGRAYLAFARKYPGHYMAMFESGIAPGQTPDLSRAADRANRVLDQRRRCALGPDPGRQAPARGDVLGAYHGDEPRDRRTLRPRQARRPHPFHARGIAGGRDRHLPARAGAGQLARAPPAMRGNSRRSLHAPPCRPAPGRRMLGACR